MSSTFGLRIASCIRKSPLSTKSDLQYCSCVNPISDLVQTPSILPCFVSGAVSSNICLSARCLVPRFPLIESPHFPNVGLTMSSIDFGCTDDHRNTSNGRIRSGRAVGGGLSAFLQMGDIRKSRKQFRNGRGKTFRCAWATWNVVRSERTTRAPFKSSTTSFRRCIISCCCRSGSTFAQ